MIERKEVLKLRCDALLTVLVGKDLVEAWWASKNKAFEEKTPQEVWDTDLYEHVYAYLMFHAGK
jgi:hypothetical protein